MHYWYRTNLLKSFIEGRHPARFFDSNKFTVSKDTLPRTTEIFILKVTRQGRVDDF
jgi:hypothetical protein